VQLVPDLECRGEVLLPLYLVAAAAEHVKASAVAVGINKRGLQLTVVACVSVREVLEGWRDQERVAAGVTCKDAVGPIEKTCVGCEVVMAIERR
jgi:hypothetical protein